MGCWRGNGLVDGSNGAIGEMIVRLSLLRKTILIPEY